MIRVILILKWYNNCPTIEKLFAYKMRLLTKIKYVLGKAYDLIKSFMSKFETSIFFYFFSLSTFSGLCGLFSNYDRKMNRLTTFK